MFLIRRKYSVLDIGFRKRVWLGSRVGDAQPREIFDSGTLACLTHANDAFLMGVDFYYAM